MKKLALYLLPLILVLPVSCSAALMWDSFTVTIQQEGSTTVGAIVDVANLHWTGELPVPNSAQLQDTDYTTTLYFFSGVQQSSDGTVVPNEQAFFTFDPALAAHVLDAYQNGELYVGLYSGPTLLDGAFAQVDNSSITIQAVPEPLVLWTTAVALALLFAMRCIRDRRVKAGPSLSSTYPH